MEVTKKKIGIIGGTGYTAGELLRLLLHHPFVEIAFVTSQSLDGHSIVEVHKDLIGEMDLHFVTNPVEVDLIFLCLPHGESQKWLIENGYAQNQTTKIIDLGNDFRVDDLWENKAFVYGLCEFNKESIQSANYIANPGCFATAIQLGLLPIASKDAISSVHVVGVTGSTGAGKSLGATTHFSWRNGNISAYKTLTHQHIAEINKSVNTVSKEPVSVQFVPWRGDFTRGIFTSMLFYSQLELNELVEVYKKAYKDSPFVFVSEQPIDLKLVINTNKALVQIEKEGNNVAVHVAIDNLLKGASGQAVQNMNLMFNWPEKTGLALKATAF